MTPKKSIAKRRLSGGRPQVLRPVDQSQIGQRSLQLTTLVRDAETELGLWGSPAKWQRTTSPVHEKSPEKREEMETVVSKPEEVLATPCMLQKKERSCLIQIFRNGQLYPPAVKKEREKKQRSKKKREEMNPPIHSRS